LIAGNGNHRRSVALHCSAAMKRRKPVLFNPIVANLHNTKTDRYHPILFDERPLPGGGGPTRHKSRGHHTEGFDTREEAIAECHRMVENLDCGGRLCIAKDFPWDGEETPAMVVFFGEVEGELQPVM